MIFSRGEHIDFGSASRHEYNAQMVRSRKIYGTI